MNFSLRTKVIAALVSVSAGYALLSVAVRLLDGAFEPLTQVYVRVTIGFLIAVVLFSKQLRWKKIKTIPTKDLIGLGLMGTIGYAVSVYCITLGAINTSLVNVSVIYSTLPFFVALNGFVFLRQKISKKLIFFLILSFIGVLIVATKSLIPVLNQFGFGDFMMLLAALTGSWYPLGRKMLSNHLNNSEVSVIVMGIAALTAFCLAMVRGEVLDLSQILHPSIIIGLAIGAGFNILATFFENFAFQHIHPVIGSQILLTENLFALVFGFLLYQEMISLPQIIGAVLIMISVYFSNTLSSSEEKE